MRGQQQYTAVQSSDKTEQIASSQVDRCMVFDYEAIKAAYNIDINTYTGTAAEESGASGDLPF